ncbi:MAG: 3-dehydroquinate synthase [Clostridia bacterium]|nr:3-dehydroquinate synthase [Clostridia bacterium]
MTDIILNTASTSVIHCGEGAFSKYAPRIEGRKFIVTDTNVYKLYSNMIEEYFADAPIKIIPAGEKSKTLSKLTEILNAMADASLKRDCTVIAFGGGVIGDIAGLAASLYMRGVKVVQIPTTLLAQVDSSVGGKTAVDFKNVKNLIGTFYQPQEVIVDPIFLKTLPTREIRCGLGEIIKYGALDKNIYDKLLICL